MSVSFSSSQFTVHSSQQLMNLTQDLCNKGSVIYFYQQNRPYFLLTPWNCFTGRILDDSDFTTSVIEISPDLLWKTTTNAEPINNNNNKRNYYFFPNNKNDDDYSFYHFEDYQVQLSYVVYQSNVGGFPIITIYPQPVFGKLVNRHRTTLQQFAHQLEGIGSSVRVIKASNGQISSLVSDISRYTRLKLSYQIILD